jgi:hypothetical protein
MSYFVIRGVRERAWFHSGNGLAFKPRHSRKLAVTAWNEGLASAQGVEQSHRRF